MTSFDPLRTAVVAVHLEGDIVGADGALAPFFRAEIERTGVLDKIGQVLRKLAQPVSRSSTRGSRSSRATPT